jgi:hypothetical protein
MIDIYASCPNNGDDGNYDDNEVNVDDGSDATTPDTVDEYIGDFVTQNVIDSIYELLGDS